MRVLVRMQPDHFDGWRCDTDEQHAAGGDERGMSGTASTMPSKRSFHGRSKKCEKYSAALSGLSGFVTDHGQTRPITKYPRSAAGRNASTNWPACRVALRAPVSRRSAK